MAVAFSDSYTLLTYYWTEWKAANTSRSGILQYDESDPALYTIWFYDGAEIFRCQIWRGAVPNQQIQLGYSQAQNDADKADFEANFKADGNTALTPKERVSKGGYMLPVNLRHAGAPIAGTTVWAMRVDPAAGPNRMVRIRRVVLQAAFDGIAAVSTPRYTLQRFDTATPTAGTDLTVVKRDGTAPGSIVTDARVAAGGLTTTGVNFFSDASIIAVPAVPGAVSTATNVWDFPWEGPFSAVVLRAGLGLAIRLDTAAIAGLSLTGVVDWDEL